jgi:5-formyltetrahydrofolate cyclo-ligase
MTKTSLRRRLLSQRLDLSPQQWQSQSLALCQVLQAWPVFQQAQTVLAYFSVRREPDLSSLFTLPKTWGFPVCHHAQLLWFPWQPGDRLSLGPYGIWQPTVQQESLLPPHIDLILVPCLAGDRQGYRLGYGGGYYDRLLAQPQWCQLPTLGIVFASAYGQPLPQDPWDQPLQGFCTELGRHESKNWQLKGHSREY